MALTEKRRAELTELMLVEVLFDDGVNLKTGMKRGITGKAKRLGISEDEMLEFASYLITKVSERAIKSLTEKVETNKRKPRSHK